MATPKQIAANRRNARLSTGPRTEAGKEIVGQNSTKHGLTGQHIVRRGDQNEAFAAFYESMLPDLAPSTALELDFARRIIHDSWRLNRAGAMSENLLYDGRCEDKGLVDYEFPDDDIARAEARAFRADAKAFNLLSLYEQRLQRAILKNLAALKAMRKERRAEAMSQPITRPKATKPQTQPIEISDPSPSNGFAFSTTPSVSSPPRENASADPENMAA